MDLYVLVDKPCLPKLMDVLVNNFIDNAVKYYFLPVEEMIDWAYAKTREGDGIRKLVLYLRRYLTTF
jgi:hypothetical protein